MQSGHKTFMAISPLRSASNHQEFLSGALQQELITVENKQSRNFLTSVYAH